MGLLFGNSDSNQFCQYRKIIADDVILGLAAIAGAVVVAFNALKCTYVKRSLLKFNSNVKMNTRVELCVANYLPLCQ